MEKKIVTIFLEKDGKTYRLTFDEYGYLDESYKIEENKPPKQLNGGMKVVQFFVRHQTSLYYGTSVLGVRYLSIAKQEHSVEGA